MGATESGALGMLAQQLKVEVISNNIANAATSGYKRQSAEFQDLMYEQENRPASASSSLSDIMPPVVFVGTGVRTSAIYRTAEQGNLQQTNNKLDLAITGPGYFQVEMPTGETGFTRAGSFQLNANGQVVTSNGFVVKPGLVLPKGATDIVVNGSGQAFAKVDGQPTPVQVGQIELATFANDSGLEARGGNLFAETPASGVPVTGSPGTLGFGSLTQGSLEASNVNIVTEITDLIAAQRAYEMNSKVIQTADAMDSSDKPKG